MKFIKTVPALLLLLLLLSSGCEPEPGQTTPAGINWLNLSQGQTVYGIVRLEVSISGAQPREVSFYLDSGGSNSFIGQAELESGSVYTCDWYTLETVNGSHTITARAAFTGADDLQASIILEVKNGSRATSIPPGAVKMTPENDTAPPVLNPAFAHIWHEPVPLPGPVNTAGAEDSPFITPDGSTFYFWFNGDQSRDAYAQVSDPMTGLYWTEKVDGQWQEPERLFLQYFDKTGFDGDPAVFGSTLWFGSIREGNYRDIDIWTAELAGGRWTSWANAGELFNRTWEMGELHIAAGGDEIYFGSAREGGRGGRDIWVIRRSGGQWQAPENISAVNTAGDEGQPFITEDGSQLWFTRLTPAPEVYRSLKVGGQWQAPEMVLSSLAGEPTMDMAGNLYFTHHRWDDALGRATEADIYVCYRR
ncbi:MAG: PD40 domain-containing protein [Dehalococcoidaceae bacterium]|nr:PD40 domain-containing protein [Dehalococcoidaceae bacterium]